MNEEISKYKGIIYLAALLIIVPIIIYMFTFRKTLNNYVEYNNILGEIENLETALVTAQPPEISITTQDYISSGLIVNYLKNADEKQADNIIIDKFVPSKIDLGNGLFIHIAQITIYSDFISIVKAINNLEKVVNQYNIISVHFQSEKNRQTNNVKLKAAIIIQQILEQ
jgi:hypothetical protein